jgi:hypothetical protein
MIWAFRLSVQTSQARSDSDRAYPSTPPPLHPSIAGSQRTGREKGERSHELLYVLWKSAARGGSRTGLAAQLVSGRSMSGLPIAVAATAQVIWAAGPLSPPRRAGGPGGPVGGEEPETRAECPDWRPCLGDRCDRPASSRGAGRREQRRGSGRSQDRKGATTRDALLWCVDTPGHSLPPPRPARREVRPASPARQVWCNPSLTLLTLSAYDYCCFQAP